jgi:hypothetical protein
MSPCSWIFAFYSRAKTRESAAKKSHGKPAAAKARPITMSLKSFGSDFWIFTACRNKEPGLNQPFKPGTCGVDVRTLRVASQRFSDSRELLSRSALTS